MGNDLRVMVVGSGGREHALVWKISQSPWVERVFVPMANAGIAMESKTVPVAYADDNASIVGAAKERSVDLVVIGPDRYIVGGLADACDDAGLLVFGTRKRAAKLEGSKCYAKDLMARYNIPTAPYRCFDTADQKAWAYIRQHRLPVVIKADGLAGGKGTKVCRTVDEALAWARQWLSKGSIVVEEFLDGEEASFTGIVVSGTFLPWKSSQDHKHLRDGDQGPRTGGMGAYSPAPVLDPEVHKKVMKWIIAPLFRGLEVEMIPYTGFLYVGLMVVKGEPCVLEFNCRLGDPEAQGLLMRLKSDLASALYQASQGKTEGLRFEWDPRPALCVVLAAHGYPGDPRKGDAITGLDAAGSLKGVKVFHAGTEYRGGKIVTAGGRIMGVTAMADTIQQARDRAYQAVEQVRFEEMHYRQDIGWRALEREVK